MARIHPLACVDPAAQIAGDAEIGPFCVIGPDVSIASGCRLIAHVHVAGRTSIGARTVVHPYGSLGGPPQSLAYRGEPTQLVIGADCDLREGVTMSVDTLAGGGVTEVGDGSGTGAFSGGFAGLTRGTAYTVRAYAVNQGGTAYSAPTAFTTDPNLRLDLALALRVVSMRELG